MLKVKQFRYYADNFAYLIYTNTMALAIDGGAVEAILSFLKEHDLELRVVINTHNHPDHTAGNEGLFRNTRAQIADGRDLIKQRHIVLDGEEIRAYRTPGHTDDSLCFHANNYLFTGDTLFNGTVGNCFSGNMKGFYKSLKMIMALPEETLIYPGHDYVQLAVDFLRKLEPTGKAADRLLINYNPQHVFSRLGDELSINPYLRFNEPQMKELLEKRGLSASSPWQRWHSLMSIE